MKKSHIFGISIILSGCIVIFLINEEFQEDKQEEIEDSLNKIELVYSKSFGGFGTEESRFNGPHGIDIFQNKIFVLDNQNGRIQVFLNDGSFDSQIPIGTSSHGMAVIKDRIFIVETYNYKILSYDHKGNLLNEFPISYSRDIEADSQFIYALEPHKKQISVFDHFGNFNFAFPVHEIVHYINSDDDKIIVSGPPPSLSIVPEIIVLNKYDGMIETRFNTSAQARGADIFQNQIFLVDGDQIKIFDLKGNNLASIGNTGEGLGEFISPSQIEFNDNFLYVLDHQNHRVQVLKIIQE